MRFFKLSFIVVLVCGLTVSAGSAVAQKKFPPGNIKFAVVNFQKIFREAAATKSIAPQIAKLKKSFEAQFKDVQKKLQAAEQKLQGQRAILSPDAYATKQKSFKRQVNGVQRNVQAVQRMVARVEGDAYKRVRQEFHRITDEIAKERSLDLIFPRSGLIHVGRKYDISNEILKRLNKRLPSVSVEMPAEKTRRPKASSRKKN